MDGSDFQITTFVSNLLASGIGAFVGAWAAFRFEARRRDDKELEGNWKSAIAAQFQLARQKEFLVILGRKLDPLRNETIPEAKLIPLEFSPKVPDVDIDSLLFIVHDQNPELVHEIDVYNVEFSNLIDTLRTRNRFIEELIKQQEHPSNWQTQVAEANAKRTFKDLLRIHGNLLAKYEHIFQMLTDYIQTRFPGKFPLRWELLKLTSSARCHTPEQTVNASDENTSKVVESYVSALAIVTVIALWAYLLGGYAAWLAPAFVRRYAALVQFASGAMVLASMFGVVGWEIATWSGTSRAERVNNLLFQCINLVATLLLLGSSAALLQISEK